MGKKDRNRDKQLERELQEKKKKAKQRRLPLIFGGILVAVAVLITVGVMSNQYDDTQTATAQLYSDQITPEVLQTKIDSKEDFFAYFYQPNCEHCKIVSPLLIPMAKELNKPLFPVDIYMKPQAWDDYKVEGTPTLIHYKDGKEVAKIVGEQPQETFREFLTK